MNFPKNKLNETVLAIFSKHCYTKMEIKTNPFTCYCKNKIDGNTQAPSYS